MPPIRAAIVVTRRELLFRAAKDRIAKIDIAMEEHPLGGEHCDAIEHAVTLTIDDAQMAKSWSLRLHLAQTEHLMSSTSTVRILPPIGAAHVFTAGVGGIGWHPPEKAGVVVEVSQAERKTTFCLSTSHPTGMMKHHLKNMSSAVLWM